MPAWSLGYVHHFDVLRLRASKENFQSLTRFHSDIKPLRPTAVNKTAQQTDKHDRQFV